VLDLCTGSGDIAILMARQHSDLRVTAVDASARMLDVARKKADGLLDRIDFRTGDALALDFPDATFDGAVISFGLRNLANLQAGLREMARVVKPGGFVCNIDQGKPRSRLFGMAYEVHFKRVAPVLGKLIFHRNEFNSFRYLPESNKYFPHQDDLIRMMEENGIRQVRGYEYWFGAVAQQVGTVPKREPEP
jgi:demethylmenaquinone methyltransferase/2-methoxy-6-polyprenyl-1,4-benzoquinol methylase